jgi:hypothetical protein
MNSVYHPDPDTVMPAIDIRGQCGRADDPLPALAEANVEEARLHLVKLVRSDDCVYALHRNAGSFQHHWSCVSSRCYGDVMLVFDRIRVEDAGFKGWRISDAIRRESA